MLALAPTADRTQLAIGRRDLSGVPDLAIERMVFAGNTLTVRVDDGVGTIAANGR
jgi:hypothetical protein